MHYIVKYYIELIKSYHGKIPLIVFLKDFYKENKQLGKRDRNALTQACFAFFRTLTTEDAPQYYPLKIVQKHTHQADWQYWKFLLDQRVTEEEINNTKLFKKQWSKVPSTEFNFSDGMDATLFNQLVAIQPKVFFRNLTIETPMIDAIEKEYTFNFDDQKIAIYRVKEDTKLEQELEEKDFIVQDLNSQRVLIEGMKKIALDLKQSSSNSLWDACAGAGGKTMLLQQIWKSKQWSASDIRPRILNELRRRQKVHNFQKINTFKIDLSEPIKDEINQQDIIVLDVPCSGSGTWGSTPERRVFFNKDEIIKWQKLQGKILQNTANILNKNGYILYMTCSVFKEENEDIIQQFLKENPTFTSLKEDLLVGLKEQADSLYYHVLKSNE